MNTQNYLSALSECREPKDLFEFQTEFFDKLFADYRKEATIISEFLFDMARPSADRTVSKKTESYEETILKAQEDAEQIINLAKQQADQIVEGAVSHAKSASKGKKRNNKVA